MYTTYEDAALAAKTLWDAGDTEGACRAVIEARNLVADKGDVYQMDDGTLQLVPLGG
jgi:ketosteroid isomerase-like protein